MATIKGIDVSSWQSVIDWNKAKADGVEFAILRAGWGWGEGQDDAMLSNHLENAYKAGVKIGIYWFGYAYSIETAKLEAAACKKAIEKYKDKITLPVFYDWEYDSADYAKKNGVTPTRELVTDMTIAFMEEMKKAGYKVGYYANLDYMRNYYDLHKIAGYDLWYARYEDVKLEYNAAILQYTSKGYIDGYISNVDCDRLIKDYFGTEKKPEPVKPATPATPAKKTNDQIATEVIRGGWGNGETRKEKLTKAGYDYAAIQKLVDAKLNPKPATPATPAKKPEPVKPATPAKKSNDEIATEVIRGDWGNGSDRKTRLEKAGYNYDAIQKLVDAKLNGTTAAAPAPAKKETVYIVQAGDTLSGIAAKYGKNYMDIAKKNNIANPNVIYPGQKLVID